jgi:hypothetical protein
MDGIFAHVRLEIEHFFTIYKELEGRKTATLGWGGPGECPEGDSRGSKEVSRAGGGAATFWEPQVTICVRSRRWRTSASH